MSGVRGIVSKLGIAGELLGFFWRQKLSFLHRETGSSNLCMAGGVALNSVANSRIWREGPFRSLYIHPAAGDGGGAVGAALYAHHCLLREPRGFIMGHAYWGEEDGEGEIRAFLDTNAIRHEYVEDEEALLARPIRPTAHQARSAAALSSPRRSADGGRRSS